MDKIVVVTKNTERIVYRSKPPEPSEPREPSDSPILMFCTVVVMGCFASKGLPDPNAMFLPYFGCLVLVAGICAAVTGYLLVPKRYLTKEERDSKGFGVGCLSFVVTAVGSFYGLKYLGYFGPENTLGGMVWAGFFALGICMVFADVTERRNGG